ncbi:MAG: hypothetical protein GDA44_05075 [Prochloron sp. SP5CPC1]|nr:hypothetical protein [Candidatus Paraprochloron terpiosi SP5CPC1]
MRIEDKTKKLSQQDIKELEDFVINDLLSTERDIQWLQLIEIADLGQEAPFGYWQAIFHSDFQNQITPKTVIVLNSFWLKTLDDLKETLAHEYGHHWTLCYLVVNKGLKEPKKQRLPEEYYKLRGLKEQDYEPDDEFKGWYFCDKEIIAEDYRVLFAPSPYNQEHQIATHTRTGVELPSEKVKKYIRNLNRQY